MTEDSRGTSSDGPSSQVQHHHRQEDAPPVIPPLTPATADATGAAGPQVLACGQRSVLIPKSMLAFPAWLVLLPDFSSRNDAAAAGDSRSPPSSPPPLTSSGVPRWRSKRDWTRLGRAAARRRSTECDGKARRGSASGRRGTASDCDYSSSNVVVDDDDDDDDDDQQQQQLPALPKAAMDRLVRNGPWVRPGLLLPARFETGDRTAVAVHLLLPPCLQQDENRWDVQWTKSLRRMDDFLRSIHRHCIRARRRNRTGPGGEAYSDALTVAWEEFCRPDDADNLLPEPDSGSLRDCAAAVGSALGQYFCSTGSAERLVRLFLGESRRRILSSALARGGPVHVTVLEPSCGDGRLVRHLVDAMQREPLLPPKGGMRSTVRVVGMDVDDSVLQVARREHRHVDGAHLAVEFVRGDFLSSERATLENASGTTVAEQRRASNQGNRLVLVIGGPPYSAGAGSVARPTAARNNDATGGRRGDSKAGGNDASDTSEAMRRDLPLQFVRHAIEEHGAEVVCFLMPERYRNCAGLRELLDRRDYCCTTLESDSLFYFQGNADHRVRQPSIIQCYQRNLPDT